MADTKKEGNSFQIWRYGNLKVFYKPELDGAGSVLAESFIDFMKSHCRYHHFPQLLEWCCGPSFWGFAMLAEGMCDELILSDVNPRAIECVKKTIAENKLEDKVRFYISDNFKDIPETESFDAIIANPPNYFNINEKHQLGAIYKNDMRASDPNWTIHKNFYAHAMNYLKSGGHCFISEIEPYKLNVFIPPDKENPYEERQQAPIIDFKAMIAESGLEYLDTRPYFNFTPELAAWVMVSRKRPKFWQRLFWQLDTLR